MKDLTKISTKEYNITIDDIIEQIEECDSFEQLAIFRTSQLEIMKKALKELIGATDRKMIDIGGKCNLGDRTISIGKAKTKKVNMIKALELVVKNSDDMADAFNILTSVLSTSAFKPAETKKFTDTMGLDDLTEIKEIDKVVVKDINKKFLKVGK